MSMPEDKRRKNPVDRFRRILSAGEKKEEASETENPSIDNLPKTRLDEPSLAFKTPPVPNSAPPPVFAAATAQAQFATNNINQTPRNNRFLPIFWTTASIVSLTCNLALLIMLLMLLRGLGSLSAIHLGPGVLGGLYNNLERMDQTHIKTTLPMQTSIPLSLTIPVQTSTSITLAQAASIPGAHVKISTAQFNIDAPASVTLPAGTSLDVAMNFDVPVQTNVPVTLSVPVDIAVRKTDLHPAIVGLQDTIRPLYCVFSPAAVSLGGEAVCK